MIVGVTHLKTNITPNFSLILHFHYSLFKTLGASYQHTPSYAQSPQKKIPTIVTLSSKKKKTPSSQLHFHKRKSAIFAATFPQKKKHHLRSYISKKEKTPSSQLHFKKRKYTIIATPSQKKKKRHHRGAIPTK